MIATHRGLLVVKQGESAPRNGLTLHRATVTGGGEQTMGAQLYGITETPSTEASVNIHIVVILLRSRQHFFLIDEPIDFCRSFPPYPAKVAVVPATASWLQLERELSPRDSSKDGPLEAPWEENGVRNPKHIQPGLVPSFRSAALDQVELEDPVPFPSTKSYLVWTLELVIADEEEKESVSAGGRKGLASNAEKGVGPEASGALCIKEESGFISAYVVSGVGTATEKTAGGLAGVKEETEFFHGAKYQAQVAWASLARHSPGEVWRLDRIDAVPWWRARTYHDPGAGCQRLCYVITRLTQVLRFVRVVDLEEVVDPIVGLQEPVYAHDARQKGIIA
ncbi:hypothetical protein B0H14DRAFT_2641314 [Mycena olivaceomarginata]|nr:hypothetical protein B0H14DRAFT_2641314 [Mycena olivaceomarginata]